MPIGGFDGPSGRRVRSLERALTASALLPTAAFAALGSLTVLLVVQMGIAPLGAVVGPSARDGGHGVTMPRMSISIGPQRLQHAARPHDRETTTADAPTTMDLVGPVAPAILPAHGRETTPDAPTGSTHPTTFMFARSTAHSIPPARDRETTTPDAQSAAMTAAVTDDAVTSAVTIGEVTTVSVEPQVLAGTDATDAPEVMCTLLARAATAPVLEPADRTPQTPQIPQNEDMSVASVKTPQNTDATQASEHAKAAKSNP